MQYPPDGPGIATPPPRRAVHLVRALVRGGVESWLTSLLPYIDRRVLEMDFMVLSPEDAAYNELARKHGSRILYCPMKPLWSYPWRLQRLFRDYHYDVVHSHMWLFSGTVLWAAARAGVPVRVAHSHDTASPKTRTFARRQYERLMRRMILHNATHCIGCSTEATRALFGFAPGENPKCQNLYCSIDIEAFRPAPSGLTKASLGIPADAPLIGNVGNLNVKKNHSFFLEVAAELLKIRSDAYFFVAGEGALRPQLEQKARDLGISQRVNFAGQRGDVPELLAHAFDVFLFPSLFEGMPLSMVEAAAGGLRTVYSDSVTIEAADHFPEAYTRLSLQLPACDWAKAVDEALRKGRLNAQKAYETVKAGRFAPESCLRDLSRIYGCLKNPMLENKKP